MPERNQKEQIKRICEGMNEQGFDWLVITSAYKIYAATGVLSWWAANAPGFTAAVIGRDGDATVICSEFELADVKLAVEGVDGVSVRTYPTWIYVEDFDDPDAKKAALPDFTVPFKIAGELIHSSSHSGKIGIETESLTPARWKAACDVFGREHMEDCSALLSYATMIKTPWEIRQLRRAAQICENVMYRTAQYVKPGMSEAEFLNAYMRFGLEEDPEVITVNQTHVFGDVYSIAAMPRKRQIRYGDVVRLDVGPLYRGYHSDLARTFVVGEAAPEKEKIYHALYAGFSRGLELIGPGVKLSDVFCEVQKTICGNGFPTYRRGHFGHSIGAGPGEQYPYIAKDSREVFQPGMVICLETPYYGTKSNSYNIEDTLLITEDGYERFTHANDTLYWK